VKKVPIVTRIVGAVIVALTISVAGVGFFVVRNDIDQMRDAGRENILWDALQIQIELMRFQRELAAFANGRGTASPASVNDRYDLLWSRVSLFRQGTVGARLRAYDTDGTILSALFAKIQKVEDQVVNLKPGDQAKARALYREFSPFTKKLRHLSQTVLHGEESNHAVLRENLAQSSNLLTIISVIAVLSSLLMIIVFARDSQQFRILARANEKLLRASDQASRAKSQFLAMMSHELRTPMNGVLGLLALIRQQGLSGHQARLLEQAERSGHQMIGLLGDILDFAALQEGRLHLENKPFEPERLAEAVGDMFSPVALREGIAFSTHVDPSCPPQVLGDFARLRQALTHLATYILETAGTENITLDISCSAGKLNAEISFEYKKDGREWQPSLIMGGAEETENSLASEALGPAVSRGLIERMGGQVRLNTPSDERISVLVSVPVRALAVDVLLIRIACRSAALEAICKAALRAENVKFVAPDTRLIPHVVMIEAGGAQEAVLARSLSRLYPEAIIVAVGRAQYPDLFDDMIEVPIDVSRIRKARFMQLASRAPRAVAEHHPAAYAASNETP